MVRDIVLRLGILHLLVADVKLFSGKSEWLVRRALVLAFGHVSDLEHQVVLETLESKQAANFSLD